MDTQPNNADCSRPRILPISFFITSDPPPRDYLFNSLSLVKGTVGMLAAPGDSAKTYITLEMVMGLCCNTFDPLQLEPTREGKVLYVSGEETDVELHTRIHKIADGMTIEEQGTVMHNLTILSTYGLRNHNDWLVTGDALIDTVCETAGNGTQLIVFDTHTRFHNLDENSNPEQAFVVSRYELITIETHAAVVFDHHANKFSMSGSGAQTDAYSHRGAAALRDNSRWCATIRPENSEGVRTLVETKHNGGIKHPDVPFLWTNGGRGPFMRASDESTREMAEKIKRKFDAASKSKHKLRSQSCAA